MNLYDVFPTEIRMLIDTGICDSYCIGSALLHDIGLLFLLIYSFDQLLVSHSVVTVIRRLHTIVSGEGIK